MREEKAAILQEVLRLLEEKYRPGLYEYLFKYREDAYKRLLALEDGIDRAYLTPGIDEEGFKAILREYWKLHIIAIKEFKQVDQLDLNIPQARQEMTAERVRA